VVRDLLYLALHRRRGRLTVSFDGPLYSLLRIIMRSGKFPDIWKLGIIVPIFKNKGSKTSVTNFRPVTLLNTLSKHLGRVIYSSIEDHVAHNNIFYETN
jgi:hypothetical protein